MSENIRRVWQYIPDFVRYIDEATDTIKFRRKDNMAFPQYGISYGSTQVTDGVQIKRPPVMLKATANGQYVVEANAPEYDLIVKVMARYVAQSDGKLKEISQLVNDNKVKLGELPSEFVPQGARAEQVTALEKKLADAEARIAELKKKQEK